jgi:hypothetical protein
MAKQPLDMPIEQDYDRNIDGLDTLTEMPEGIEFDDDEEAMIEEQPDGSAIVTLDDDEEEPQDLEFYSNLAETVAVYDMNSIAMKYLDYVSKDKEAREQRDKQYEEGIRRTGLGNDAPGGASFQGASKVVHPVMAEACVDFASGAIKELFPPDGPTRTNILGEATEEKVEKAERKRDYMNWQLVYQIPEFRDEEEQLLTQLPMGGSQFLKLWYDEQKHRPRAEFVAIDNILLPFAASNFYEAQRVTEVHDITQETFEDRINSGLYRDINFVRATEEPDPTKPEQANAKVEGKQFQDNIDGVRRVYHIYTYLELEDDRESGGERAPYIVMIDDLTSEVLGIYRNWEEGDETMTKLDWIIEFKFIPWRGAYAIGLPHLIGGLSAALTGALRALLDTAHINNSATMLKLKGAKMSGQSQEVEVTQVVELEAAPGVDDIRKIAMPLPFNPPSQVLFELLGWLDTAAKGVVSTSEEKIADVNANTPVGTAQALIEQGAKVFSAIHARLHDSQRRVLQVLGRINRWYLEDMQKGDEVADLPITPQDFEKNNDVLPVSDPHIFCETQRMAQNQAVLQLATQYPQLFDMRAVMTRMLKQMKVPALNELMPNALKPTEMDASNENASMSLGKPAFAYPRQDHLAHIQSHLNYALDPNLGSNPIIAPQFIPQVLEHIKQHITLWYTGQVNGYATYQNDMNLAKYAESKMVSEIDKVIAVASEHVKLDSQQTFEKLMPAIQQLQQMMQQFAPKPQMDGADIALLQAAQMETQRKAAKDQQDAQIAAQKLIADAQGKQMSEQGSTEREMARIASQAEQAEKDRQVEVAMNTENNLTNERIKAADITVDEVRLRQEQQETAIQLNNEIQRNLGGSNGNNG